MAENKYTPNPRKYYKTNFVDLIELITPEVYKTEDLSLSGTELNPISQIINSNLHLANNINSVISISAVENTQTSSINTISGISQYFVKQNGLTKITPFSFEEKILLPIGRSLANFDTSGEFSDYLSATLLPSIIPATGANAASFATNLSLSGIAGSTDPALIHNQLIDTLGWYYFLNTSADGGLTFSPSSIVLSGLNSLYLGKTLETVDGIKGLTEYLWKNNETCSFGGYIPAEYVSGIADGITEASAGPIPTHTSGTQKLDALKTLMDVVYSPLYIDQQDYTVKAAFESYIDAGTNLIDQTAKGPHRHFNNILGFGFADISDQVENIGLIYDIENAKDENLQYIADLIGWKLRGSSANKWRHQLRIALDLYKKSGTITSIQTAINALITDSVFDVSGKVQELWESYIPHLIWYSLGTESDLFKNLETWTAGKAEEAGVRGYSTSSLEENLKIVTDSILLDLYRKFPDNFIFHGGKFPVPRLVHLDNDGCEKELYTIINEPGMKPFHLHLYGSVGYEAFKQDAKLHGESNAFKAATSTGPIGTGVYMAGSDHPTVGRPVYLKPLGDLNFLYNYREKQNYPLPPFEEIKFYRDATITADLVEYLVERLKCFRVEESFADDVGNYILSSAVTDESDLGALNEFLMFFSSVQVPPNFNNVMMSISDYEKNLLNLWNGKSSHLFINFADTDFDFSKTTMEGDGKYALYEASRVAKEFSPAHAITRVNLTASAEDAYSTSSAKYEYLGFDKDDNLGKYTSGAALANYEWSGVLMGFADGGGDGNQSASGGRGGLNTFKRVQIDNIRDVLLSSTQAAPSGLVPRRAIRRRNTKFVLPHEGYYDRTGFNGPVSYDPSTLETSLADQASGLGELTLGYVASAGKFHPIVDFINPSGIWDECEGLNSSRQFSGVYTSATFPYRGLHTLGSNNKMPELSAATARYIDRGQLPELYNTMHELFEKKAKDLAFRHIAKDPNVLKSSVEGSVGSDWQASGYAASAYFMDSIQSHANAAIASGFVLNSFHDYENFQFGLGLHKLYRDYTKYFAKHVLGLNEIIKTGGNIFAQVYGKGLFNCDFDIAGSGVGNMVAPTTESASAVNVSNVWKITEPGTSGTYGTGRGVLPLSGTYIEGNADNAEFRNAQILSGIEFCDISGAPSANQFTIFKLDSSTAVKGMESPLVDNAVIKCKSVGGLPRLRFDLSTYGYRPNHFIRDHVFKLDIKALVAEENSPILGGGKLGVWIHTQPISRPNPNLLSFSQNDLSSTSTYWNMSTTLGTMSSVAETNPFGGSTSLVMSGLAGITSPTYGGVAATSSGPRMPTLHADKSIAASFFVKKSSSNAVSGFMIDIANTDTTSTIYDDHTDSFIFDGTVPELRVSNHSNQSQIIEPYGNDWYRVTTILEGISNTTEEQTGDALKIHFFIGDGPAPAGYMQQKEMLVWGFQVEQYWTDTKLSPSLYEAVPGLLPTTSIYDKPRYYWSWTPKGKWEVIEESKLSIDAVKNSLSHIYEFPTKTPDAIDEEFCLGNTSDSNQVINNNTLKNLKSKYFEDFTIEFDTRNFTIYNNFEYLDIIPIENSVYEVTEQVNMDNTNYVVEVFFVPNNNSKKYLLLDSIELQDVTQRENAAIGTGFGIQTSGVPFRPFVKEDKLYLESDQLRDVLKFYDGLAGYGVGLYSTPLASRVATITSEVLELSGGSRLNYRIAPDWTRGLTKQANFLNYTNVELDN